MSNPKLTILNKLVAALKSDLSPVFHFETELYAEEA